MGKGQSVILEDSRKVLISATLLLSGVGVTLLFVILQRSRTLPFVLQERQPGMDRTGTAAVTEEKSPILLGKLVPGVGTPAPTLAGAWPRFRGANGDNIATEPVAISRKWEATGPAKLWSIDLGEGYAGAAIVNGRVYVLDYDQAESADALRCLSLADGKEIWRFSYPVKTKRNHGMSRTTPTVVGKYVISLGPKCHVVCLDATTGNLVWGIDLVKDYNTEVPQWYAGQCPLVDGQRVILAPGGDALMIAVELATGKVIWKTPNPHDWKMTHSSIVPIEFAGKRQYVYCGSGGVAGIAAEDGQQLWQTDAWQISIATVPSPIDLGAGKLFFAGGYNAGALMVQLKQTDGTIVPEKLFSLNAAVFGATQQTPILYQGNIYGVRPDGQLTCLDLTGKVRWTSGTTNKFGLGPLLIGNGLIFVMNDEGLLTLAEATPAAYRPLAKAQILHGHDSWGPLALAGGRLLARDLTQMVCLDVTGGKL